MSNELIAGLIGAFCGLWIGVIGTAIVYENDQDVLQTQWITDNVVVSCIKGTTQCSCFKQNGDELSPFECKFNEIKPTVDNSK